MKIKSVLASVAACAIAVSAMAISAAAEVTNGNATGDDGKKFWMYDVKENASDITQVYGFELKITAANPELPDGMGGGLGMNSNSFGWKSVEWGNPGSGKDVEFDAENWTVKYVADKAFAADDEYAQVWLQNWWGSELTVDSVKLLDQNGNEIGGAAQDPEETTAPEETQAPTEETKAADDNADSKADDTTGKQDQPGTKTGDAGVAVAVAGLSLAGAAAFVARKRK